MSFVKSTGRVAAGGIFVRSIAAALEVARKGLLWPNRSNDATTGATRVAAPPTEKKVRACTMVNYDCRKGSTSTSRWPFTIAFIRPLFAAFPALTRFCRLVSTYFS